MNTERDNTEKHEWQGCLSSGVKCSKCGAGPFFLAREIKEQVYCQPKGEKMEDEREIAFQSAFQTIDLAKHPTLGGITRKFEDVSSHVANGGTESGPCLTVQSERKTDYRIEHAIDLMSCLPTTPRGALIVIAQYCQPPMLDEYPQLCKAIEDVGLRPKYNQWEWTASLSRAAGSYCRAFWKKARERRIWPKRSVANF